MNHILLFGAGKSATVLINYLSQLTEEKKWQVTIADGNAELLAQKVIPTSFVTSTLINIEDANSRQALIEQANVVIIDNPEEFQRNSFYTFNIDTGSIVSSHY